MRTVSQGLAGGRSPWRWIAVTALVAAGGAFAWLSREHVDAGELRREGQALLEQGRTADAIGAFERALTAGDDATLRLLLAGALKAVGRPEDASREYKRALTLEPRNAVVWFNYGNLLRVEFKDVRSALEAYRQASECDSNFGEAQFSLGAMLLETGDHDAAIATLQSALQVAKPGATWRADAENTLNLARLRRLEAQGKLKPPRQ